MTFLVGSLSLPPQEVGKAVLEAIAGAGVLVNLCALPSSCGAYFARACRLQAPVLQGKCGNRLVPQVSGCVLCGEL